MHTNVNVSMISTLSRLVLNAKRRFLRMASMSSKKNESETQIQHCSTSENDSTSTTTTTKSEVKMKPKSDSAEDCDKPLMYATRGNVSVEQHKEVDKEKERICSLNIAEKRRLYLCKNKYTELKDIDVWPKYFLDVLAHDSHASNWWKRNKDNVIEDVNPDLNEKISIFRGDITTLEIDAIVNAANESLLGGGGVDGAIHRSAGSRLLKECELLKGCSAGNAKITCGYKLPAKHVIHTVGPRGENPELLRGCYQVSLDLMKENKLSTVAFPCISTGIFGYPNEKAAKIALKTVRQWLDTERDYAEKVKRIIFCLFLDKDVDIYNEQLQLFFPVDRE